MKRKREMNCEPCGKTVRVRSSANAVWTCNKCADGRYPVQLRLMTKEEIAIKRINRTFAGLSQRLGPSPLAGALGIFLDPFWSEYRIGYSDNPTHFPYGSFGSVESS